MRWIGTRKYSPASFHLVLARPTSSPASRSRLNFTYQSGACRTRRPSITFVAGGTQQWIFGNTPRRRPFSRNRHPSLGAIDPEEPRQLLVERDPTGDSGPALERESHDAVLDLQHQGDGLACLERAGREPRTHCEDIRGVITELGADVCRSPS